MASNERLSRALMTFGEGLGQLAEVSFTRERDAADRLHRESMARLAEQRADARQAKELEFRAGESEADRAARAAESQADREFAAEENRKDRKLTSERLSAQDRRAIESQAQGMLAEIDGRMIELRDKLMEFKVEGLGTIDPAVEQQIMSEMQQLSDARARVRYSMIEQLATMEDPRYAGMDRKTRLIEAGYTPKQIEMFEALAAEGGGAKTGAEEELAPITVTSQPRNPNAINADEIIQRPSGRRRRRSTARALMFDTPGGRGGFGDPEVREGKFFESLFQSFATDAAEDRRRLMESQFERRDKGIP